MPDPSRWTPMWRHIIDFSEYVKSSMLTEKFPPPSPMGARSGVGKLSRRGVAESAASTARPVRVPNTSPSRSEFDPMRFAPCSPVQVTSPAASSNHSDIPLPRSS